MSKDSLSDEDKALFRQMMGDVKPLIKKQGVDNSSPKKTNSKPLNQEKPIETKNSCFLSDYYSEAVQSDTLLSYLSHSIPKKRFRELQSGLIPYKSRLDLHGLRPDSAREALIRFLQNQQDLGHRCLLIVHGKGNHQGEAPILKNLVNRWLPQFPQVLAFHSALPKDGGSGALYVLLKKNSAR